MINLYIFAGIILFLGLLIALQFRRCSQKHIIVVYNRITGKPIVERISRGGGQFVIPFIQGSLELSAEPLTMAITLYNIMSKDKNAVSIQFVITTEFSRHPEILQNAINNLAGYSFEKILIKIREVATNLLIDEIANSDVQEIGERKFLRTANDNLKEKYKEIGINLKEIVL